MAGQGMGSPSSFPNGMLLKVSGVLRLLAVLIAVLLLAGWHLSCCSGA